MQINLTNIKFGSTVKATQTLQIKIPKLFKQDNRHPNTYYPLELKKSKLLGLQRFPLVQRTPQLIIVKAALIELFPLAQTVSSLAVAILLVITVKNLWERQAQLLLLFKQTSLARA